MLRKLQYAREGERGEGREGVREEVRSSLSRSYEHTDRQTDRNPESYLFAVTMF